MIVPKEADYARHIYHIYAIRVQNRDELMKFLAEKGISIGIYYPIPVHLQETHQFLGLGKGSFSVAGNCANEFLSLPMFPELTNEQIEYIVEQIEQFMAL